MSLIAASAAAPHVVNQLANFLRSNPQILNALRSAAGGVANYVKNRGKRRRNRRNRGGRGSRGLVTSRAPAPIARRTKVRTQGGSKGSFTRSRVRLSGMEELSAVYGDKSGHSQSFPVSPAFATLAWLRHMAAHFQHFVVHKWTVQYVPRVPTTKEGKITLAPEYDFAHAGDGNAAYGTSRSRLGSSWLLQNPDARQSNVSSRLSVNTTTSKFSRSGGSKYRSTATELSEASVPAFIRCVCETTDSSRTKVGTLLVDYDIELIGAKPLGANAYASMRVDSADGSALGLHEASEYRGDISPGDTDSITHAIQAISTNTLRFNMAGTFMVTAVWVGSSSPTADLDGHIVLDADGDDVGVQAFARNSNAGFSQMGSNLSVGGSSEYLQMFLVDVNGGDTLTFDTLASGTLSSFLVNINPWSGHFVPYSTST